MSKIIINCTGLTDKAAIDLVAQVIEDGFVSEGSHGKQYCFATMWSSGARAYCHKTKNGTFVFNVWSKY